MCCCPTFVLQSDRFTKHFASFGREAALLADLNHPNVLRFYGVVTESAADSSVIGIMTEYIRGGSMSAFLRWVPGGQRGVSLWNFLRLGACCMHAHRGCMHCNMHANPKYLQHSARIQEWTERYRDAASA